MGECETRDWRSEAAQRHTAESRHVRGRHFSMEHNNTGNHHRNAIVVHSYQHEIYKEFLPIAVTREQNLDFAK